MTRAQVDAVSADPATKALDLMIVSVILGGIRTGDPGRLGFLLDRTIGKWRSQDLAPVGTIPEEPEISADEVVEFFRTWRPA